MISTSTELLGQLSLILEQLTDKEYKQPLGIMNGATIGQHFRHTLEFYTCLLEQKESGTIDYDLRRRDLNLETSVADARSTISSIIRQLEENDRDFPLLLRYRGSSDEVEVASNYFRELIYVVEHAVHHMALIRIGLKEINENIEMPASFGVAASTLRFRNSIPAA